MRVEEEHKIYAPIKEYVYHQKLGKVSANPVTYILHLLKKLNYKYYPTKRKQYPDGTIVIYNDVRVKATFRYFGGKRIYNVRINSKQFSDRPEYKEIVLHHKVYAKSDLLYAKLNEIFPDSKECNHWMKNSDRIVYDMLDTYLRNNDNVIEVDRKGESESGRKAYCDIYIINDDAYISVSFRYFTYTGVIRNVFIKTSSRKRPLRVKKLDKVPDGLKREIHRVIQEYVK